MSMQQLADIANGIGWGGSSTPIIGSQSDSVPGAAGETTSKYLKDSGIPNIILSDGPAGIRITQSFTGNDAKTGASGTYYQYCTAWPIGTLLAMTWDVNLQKKVGEAIGTEMTEYGVTLWLAPGMNIHRNPLCGRNFEYFSEDSLVTGLTGAAETNGVQSHPGIGVTIKHFATNNQEDNRSSVNNIVSERALREIYLKSFEIVVKSAQSMAIMTAYNRINGISCAANYDLCTDITRGEWGFKGLVMTDWGSEADAGKSMHAGNDLIMPGGSQSTILAAATIAKPEFNTDGTIKVKTVSSWFGDQQVEQWNDFVPDKNANGTYATTVKDGYTTYSGHYKDDYITKGDLQKSVINVLNIVMQSTQMGKVNNVTIKPYSQQFKLAGYVSGVKSSIIAVPTSQNGGSSNNSGSGSSGTPVGDVTPTRTFSSDTTRDFSVKSAYQFKITSTNGQVPTLIVGTAGVFNTQLVKTIGNDYYFTLIAIGNAGARAGINVNGEKLLVATVDVSVLTLKCDTTHPFSVKSGTAYTFKITADARPTFVAGSSSAFKVEFVKAVDNDYFFKVTAVGKAGLGSGFYINSSKTPVAVATIS